MKLWDYHTHNQLCLHADGMLEEYVRAGIEKGLAEIGLSDHFPMYLLPEAAHVWQYSMKREEFPSYIQEVKRLKEDYKDKIIVRVASEVDFYAPCFLEYKKAVSPYLDQMDYLLGSIHVIGPWENTEPFGVDDDIGMEKCKEFGANKVYIEYYKELGHLVDTRFYNILGHLDLPKKFGVRPESPEEVMEHVLRLLDKLAKSEMSVEINMAGLLKPVKEPYPSTAIIQEMIDRKIPINLGSDSHKPINVGYHFEEMVQKLKKIGLKHLCKWEKREKILIPIN